MVSLQKSILIGDNDHKSRALLSDAFQKKGWIVHSVRNGRDATHLARNFSPDMILLNISMPIRDGFSTCRILRNDITITKIFPVILMGNSPDRKLIIKAIEAGCDDFVLKPIKFEVLLAKVEKLVQFYQRQEKNEEKESTGYQKGENESEIIVYTKKAIQSIFSNVMRGESIDYPGVQEVVSTMIETLHKTNNIPMAIKIKSHNEYIYNHSVNVASLCMSFAYHLQWNDNDLQILGEGGLLHDLGKAKIDLKILLKPEKLSDAEFSEMMKHPLFAKEILTKQNIKKEVQKVAIEHHERIDASGYPHKLHNEKISKYGKLAAIVDTYDAMTTDRCYRKAIETGEAIREMSRLSGKFDPELFDKFNTMLSNKTIGK